MYEGERCQQGSTIKERACLSMFIHTHSIQRWASMPEQQAAARFCHNSTEQKLTLVCTQCWQSTASQFPKPPFPLLHHLAWKEEKCQCICVNCHRHHQIYRSTTELWKLWKIRFYGCIQYIKAKRKKNTKQKKVSSCCPDFKEIVFKVIEINMSETKNKH